MLYIVSLRYQVIQFSLLAEKYIQEGDKAQSTSVAGEELRTSESDTSVDLQPQGTCIQNSHPAIETLKLISRKEVL